MKTLKRNKSQFFRMHRQQAFVHSSHPHAFGDVPYKRTIWREPGSRKWVGSSRSHFFAEHELCSLRVAKAATD